MRNRRAVLAGSLGFIATSLASTLASAGLFRRRRCRRATACCQEEQAVCGQPDQRATAGRAMPVPYSLTNIGNVSCMKMFDSMSMMWHVSVTADLAPGGETVVDESAEAIFLNASGGEILTVSLLPGASEYEAEADLAAEPASVRVQCRYLTDLAMKTHVCS